MPQPKTFDRADLVRFFHDTGVSATVGRFKVVRDSPTLFGETETHHFAVEAETVGLWCEQYKFAIVIQAVRFPDGGLSYLPQDSPLRRERTVTIRYGDGGSSAQLVRWVAELADQYREDVRVCIPAGPIDLTHRGETLYAPFIPAAELRDPEPEPDSEQPDAADEDHGTTGTTIDDVLNDLDGGDE
jgi:hypothetical protein